MADTRREDAAEEIEIPPAITIDDVATLARHELDRLLVVERLPCRHHPAVASRQFVGHAARLRLSGVGGGCVPAAGGLGMGLPHEWRSPCPTTHTRSPRSSARPQRVSTKPSATASSKAAQTLRNLDWFEVVGVRGHLVDGAGRPLSGHDEAGLPHRRLTARRPLRTLERQQRAVARRLRVVVPTRRHRHSRARRCVGTASVPPSVFSSRYRRGQFRLVDRQQHTSVRPR